MKRLMFRLSLGLIAAGLVWTRGVAVAQPQEAVTPPVGLEPTVAVIDVYLRDNLNVVTGDYARSVAAALAKTGKYAVMDRNEVLQRFKSVLITPIRRLQMERLAIIENLIREGDELVYTNPKRAVEVLARAREELEAIAEGVAANKKLRQELLKTLMLLARSHLDSGNQAKAREVLREVVRIYGDTIEVTERDYHPRLVALYKKVKKTMKRERAASLFVQTTTPGCVVLLDGHELPGTTPGTFTGLYPGLHHVQARCGEKESMIRKVVLVPKKTVKLMINVDYETALTVEGGRLGLIFVTREEAEQYTPTFAAKFGSTVNADLVLAVGFLQPGPRSVLSAWLVDVQKGEVLKKTEVPAKTDVVTPSSVNYVVKFLTAEEPIGGLAAVRKEVEGVGGYPWYKNYWGWIAVGVGVAAAGASGALFASYLSHKDKATSPYTATTQAGLWEEYNQKLSHAQKAIDMRKASAGLLGVSVAAIGTGIALFVLTDKIFPPEGSAAPRRPERAPVRLVLLPTVGRYHAGLAGILRF